MSLRWMGIHSVGYFVASPGSGDVARSWNFLGSCLFLVEYSALVRRSVQSLVVTLLRALRPNVGGRGSQSGVGRVMVTGSDAGAGLPTRRFYYVLVLLGMTQDGRLSLRGQRDRSKKICTKAEASQRRASR